jgi:hypothetical protein
MYQVDNRTDWSAGLYPGWGRDRKRQETLVFKAGYRFDAAGELSLLPDPSIEAVDSYTGDPVASSLSAACETVPFKKGGELLLFGSAHPNLPDQTFLQVRVSLKQRNDRFWEKELRVLGPRVWDRKILSTPGIPKPITKPVPLVYENAYGGADPVNPQKIFPANPAGVGYSFRGLRTKGLTLPQIECGPKFIETPASRVTPAGFGPIAQHWESKCRETVKIDEGAITTGGCPWAEEPPESLYNMAPPDQRFDEPFDGEMTLSLKGLVADAPRDVLINLPEIKPRVQFVQENESKDFQAVCDTMVVRADRKEITLIFRCALPWAPENSFRGKVILQDLAAKAEEQREQEVEATS